jgi:hypothetical protein
VTVSRRGLFGLFAGLAVAPKAALMGSASEPALAAGVGRWTYQWIADGVPITGANGATLTLTSDMVGKVLNLAYTAGADDPPPNDAVRLAS